jgi:hypothetical protein
MSPEEQELLMWTEGVPVASKVMHGYRFLLVQLYSFYVELKYLLQADVLKGFHPFNNMDGVDPYLPDIVIKFPD